MKIIEQGFVCNDPEYYLFGFKNTNSKENTPAVCIDNKNRHKFCARVKSLGYKVLSLKYFKPGELTEELLSYAREHKYRVI